MLFLLKTRERIDIFDITTCQSHGSIKEKIDLKQFRKNEEAENGINIYQSC